MYLIKQHETLLGNTGTLILHNRNPRTRRWYWHTPISAAQAIKLHRAFCDAPTTQSTN